MEKKYKIYVFAVIFLLQFSFGMKETFAEDSVNNNIDLIKEYAYEWVTDFKPNSSLKIDEVIYVENCYSDNAEYLVQVKKNEVDYGYLSLEICNGDILIKEYCLNENVESPIKKLYALAKSKGLNYKKEFFEVQPFCYAIKFINNYHKEEMLDLNGNIMSGGSDVYNSGTSIFISKSNFNSSKYVVDQTSVIWLSKFVKNRRLISDELFRGVFRLYACAPQALLQIASLEGILTLPKDEFQENIKYKMYNLYCELWDDTETESNYENYFRSGNTNWYKAIRGFGKFIGKRGYTIGNTSDKNIDLNTIKETTGKPDITKIISLIKKNKSILMLYHINKYDENKKIKNIGHYICILGYKKAKKVSSGITYNYLAVYNGYDDNIVYLNYDCVDTTSCECIGLNATKKG